MEKQVKNILQKTVKKLYDIDVSEIELSVPPKKKLWDFAFACFPVAKIVKTSPQDIVLSIKNAIETENFPEIKKLETAGPYLNIFIERTKQWSLVLLNKLIETKNDFSESSLQNSEKTIIVDYIWANVGKPLHIGHICTPTQWQSMINAYKKAWYNVISDSHIWDWWIIFWKLITAYKKYGDETKLKENAVDYLLELYVKITSDSENNEALEEQFREEFKKLSNGDSQSIELWKMFTAESIDAMNEILARLHVKPDFNIGESFYEGIGLPKIENYPDLSNSMHQVVDELVAKWIATKNQDNSVWVEFPEETGIPWCVLQKRNGTHGYLASDIACIKYRMQNWSPDHIRYFVDIRQKLHLEQVFYISTQAWWLQREWKADTSLSHASNGFISGKDGAFSTRKWNIIKLWNLLDEAEERAKKLILEKRQDFDIEKLTEISRMIGIWAIKYGYLKKKRTTDVVFDWDEFMTFEGNSGPYIQYAYVRASKILQDYNISGDIDFSDEWEYQNTVALEKFEILCSKIASFYKKNWVLEETIDTSMPHLIAGFSYELTKDFSDFYDKVRIASEDDINMKNAYIIAVKHYVTVIEDCFSILWIELPDEM
jgi:arginyl-tRNA synthetase